MSKCSSRSTCSTANYRAGGVTSTRCRPLREGTPSPLAPPALLPGRPSRPGGPRCRGGRGCCPGQSPWSHDSSLEARKGPDRLVKGQSHPWTLYPVREVGLGASCRGEGLRCEAAAREHSFPGSPKCISDPLAWSQAGPAAPGGGYQVGLQRRLQTRAVPVVLVQTSTPHPHPALRELRALALTQQHCEAHLAQHGWEQHPGGDEG